MGTTTVPLGCTSGCPPMPVARFAVAVAGPPVRPPSVEVLIRIPFRYPDCPTRRNNCRTRAGRVAIAHDPVFVGARDFGADVDRILAGKASVGRAAHNHGRGRGGVGDGRGRDHPHTVLGVVSYGRIAGCVVETAAVSVGEAGKKSVGPSAAAVGGSGPSDRRSATGRDASGLKGSQRRHAIGEDVRLNFGGGLTRTDGGWVRTDLDERYGGRVLGISALVVPRSKPARLDARRFSRKQAEFGSSGVVPDRQSTPLGEHIAEFRAGQREGACLSAPLGAG